MCSGTKLTKFNEKKKVVDKNKLRSKIKDVVKTEPHRN